MRALRASPGHAVSEPARSRNHPVSLAVERLLEMIGEAAKSLSEDFRSQHPGIPWSDIIGMRVVLAHHYHRVDPGQVWVIAATEYMDKPLRRKSNGELWCADEGERVEVTFVQA